jgi:hypothetical protein
MEHVQNYKDFLTEGKINDEILNIDLINNIQQGKKINFKEIDIKDPTTKWYLIKNLPYSGGFKSRKKLNIKEFTNTVQFVSDIKNFEASTQILKEITSLNKHLRKDEKINDIIKIWSDAYDKKLKLQTDYTDAKDALEISKWSIT